MAKFLTTTGTNFYLEELIKQAAERLILISPFLKLNDRIKELLLDKDRMKIDVRIVYGKNDLAPQEMNWLRGLEFVRTSFCQNLHAKCYLNERAAIITSMNLYDFSQVNNNEMGVYVERESDSGLYADTYEEAQRLIRISEQVRMSAETVSDTESAPPEDSPSDSFDKLSTSRLAKHLKKSTGELTEQLLKSGFLLRDGDQYKLTEKGKESGGEFRFSKRFGPYFLWPADVKLTD